jgi:3-hydroxyacyl-CoA dehydrogenase
MSSWTGPEIAERTVTVLGAGVLGERYHNPFTSNSPGLLTISSGRRIACSWVAGGYNTVIRDPSAEQRKAALHFIDNNVEDFSKILKVTAAKPGRYSAVEDLGSAVANAWFVVEAAPEKLDLKISIFKDLAEKAPKTVYWDLTPPRINQA